MDTEKKQEKLLKRRAENAYDTARRSRLEFDAARGVAILTDPQLDVSKDWELNGSLSSADEMESAWEMFVMDSSTPMYVLAALAAIYTRVVLEGDVDEYVSARDARIKLDAANPPTTLAIPHAVLV